MYVEFLVKRVMDANGKAGIPNFEIVITPNVAFSRYL
jgi:hypothetical protein